MIRSTLTRAGQSFDRLPILEWLEPSLSRPQAANDGGIVTRAPVGRITTASEAVVQGSRLAPTLQRIPQYVKR